jgi:hypothetical protein
MDVLWGIIPLYKGKLLERFMQGMVATKKIVKL